jgi:hypothetical protein
VPKPVRKRLIPKSDGCQLVLRGGGHLLVGLPLAFRQCLALLTVEVLFTTCDSQRGRGSDLRHAHARQ